MEEVSECGGGDGGSLERESERDRRVVKTSGLERAGEMFTVKWQKPGR